MWLAPFHNLEAQEDVLREVESLSNRVILPTFTAMRLITGGAPEPSAGPLTTPRQSSIARAMRTYRNTGIARAAVRVPSLDALNQLVAAGVSHRIDPVQPIRVAAPGDGTEPTPPFAPGDAPIVGVVDGGLNAASYSACEAWRAPPLISNKDADSRHGNAISSLVVQGHAWNTNRLLPELTCRVGTVQAVPRATANRRFDKRELIEYLAAVVRGHPETHVWNISANQEGPQFDRMRSASSVMKLPSLLEQLTFYQSCRSVTSAVRSASAQTRRPTVRRQSLWVGVLPTERGGQLPNAHNASGGRGRTGC